MNKGKSAAALTLGCFLTIVFFGYYLESDSMRQLYPTRLINRHSSGPPDAEFAIRAESDTGVPKDAPILAVSSEYSDAVEGSSEASDSEQESFKSSEGNTSDATSSVDVDIPPHARETPHAREIIPLARELPLAEEPPLVKGVSSAKVSHLVKSVVSKVPPLAITSSNTSVHREADIPNRHSKDALRYIPPVPHKLPREENVIFHRLPKPLPDAEGGRVGLRGPIPRRTMAAKTPAAAAAAREERLMLSRQHEYLRKARLESQGPQNWRGLPTKLYQLAPAIFDTVPKNFLPEFKSPCWYSNGQLLCLPYFYILGFPKAGTTDLWDKINNHPEVIRTVHKETHFWRDHKIGNGAAFMNYLSNAMLLTHQLKAGQTKLVSGDGSATTVISHSRYVKYFYKNVSEMYTNVDIIKELTPQAKMIIAIREPTERLYSGYLYHPINHKRSVQDFHKEVQYYIEMFEKCREEHPELRCVFEKNKSEVRSQRLKTGIYAPYIKSWVDGFGFDQVKIIRLEDWRDNCTGVLPEIFQFLDIAPQRSTVIKQLCIRGTANQSKVHIGPMLNETRETLEHFYEPFNKQLSQLLETTVYPPNS